MHARLCISTGISIHSQMVILLLLLNLDSCPKLLVLHATRLSNDIRFSMSLLPMPKFSVWGAIFWTTFARLATNPSSLVYCFQTSEFFSLFWKQQLSIIAQKRLLQSLSAVVATIFPDHNGRIINLFVKGLQGAHWNVTSRVVSYLMDCFSFQELLIACKKCQEFCVTTTHTQ